MDYRDELRRIFNRKFTKKIDAMEKFLSLVLQSVELVQIPEKEVLQEERVRDVNDRPITRAAVSANVDVILTGDKDFLESGITQPKVMMAAKFLFK